MSKGKVYLDVSQARHENCLHFEKENNQPSLFFGIYLPYRCEMTTSNCAILTFRVSVCDWTTMTCHSLQCKNSWPEIEGIRFLRWWSIYKGTLLFRYFTQVISIVALYRI